MADWQERITRDTKPSIRVEHDLRYAVAAPLVLAAPTWVDLGCGAGVAAADALGEAQLGRVVLVDADADALDQAARDLRTRDTARVQADLATDEGVAAVRGALGETPGVITCFEVVEHLATFVPLIGALIELAERGWTVVLSVPNDAFWALENPYHETMWGEGAFEELRRLLPEDAVVARQIPLDGSHLVIDDRPLDLPAVTPRPDAIPSHFLAAFGPRAAELVPRALAIPSDLDGRRTWERQRESTLAVLEAELEELRANVKWSSEEIARLNAQLGRP
jgi:SAM-dependent methyltransferase